MSTWVRTFTGKRVELEAPTVDMICIEDIAHALGNLGRFNGHTKYFYSVAQHSWNVAMQLKDDDYDYDVQFHGLLHDAQEAYIGDMVSPLKRIKSLGVIYAEIEDRFSHVIAEKFGLLWDQDMNKAIHKADMQLCATEMRDLMTQVDPFPGIEEPTLCKIKQWYGVHPEERFLEEFKNLSEQLR